MGNNLPVVSAPSPLQTGVAMQQAPIQVQDGSDGGGGGGMQPAHSPTTMMYNAVNVPHTAPPAVQQQQQQMYGPAPPMYTHPASTGVGVYPHMMGYPNPAAAGMLPAHVHPHVATAVPGVNTVPTARVRSNHHHYPHGHVPTQHGAPQCTVTDHSHHGQGKQQV